MTVAVITLLFLLIALVSSGATLRIEPQVCSSGLIPVNWPRAATEKASACLGGQTETTLMRWKDPAKRALNLPTAQLNCKGLCAHFRYLAAKRLKGWHRMEEQRNRLRAALMRRPSVSEAINLACVVYGHCAELWRKARCESHLNPNARNGSEASGLFQFLPSTWRSTPFGGFSIWSPYANAMAAGWMHAIAHRGNEWVCK